MDQIHVQLPRGPQSRIDYILRDGIKGDALVFLELQSLFQVPGDGLPFAIRVSGQINGLGP